MATPFGMKHSLNEPVTVEAQPEVASPRVVEKQRGGFDCEFIERPQEAFQADCPICLLVLREPHQVTCCGNSFCQTCIERVEADEKSCPTCVSMKFSVFPNKGLKRSLYVFRVQCSHKKDGCQWTGELGELDKHLNVSPKLHEQLVGCEFSEIECHHCCEHFQRRYVIAHQIEDCIRRPFSCDYCGNYGADFEDVTTKHWPVCGSRPVPCPNECGVHPERQNLEQHTSNECPLAVVNCDFHYAGCEVQLCRKDMPNHLAKDLVVHISLMAAHSRQLEQKVQALQVTLDRRNERIVQLEQKMAASTPLFPIEFTMTNFGKHRRENSTWYSPPFYTHPHGYKLCLRVIPNFMSKGAEIAIDACLMCGEFDSFLVWPFQGSISIELLNQLDNSAHLQQLTAFHRSSQLRVVGRERAEEGCSHTRVAYSKLAFIPAKNCQYLKDDCLHLRVTNVANVNWTEQCLVSELCIAVPPIQFRMTDFNQYRRSNDMWFSLPFYSHTKGYRLCLCVQANGFTHHFGAHIAIAVNLLSGKFDDQLKWPFEAEITIQLLNQLENKRHHAGTIHHSSCPEKFGARVRAGGRARGIGYGNFITHNELTYNRARNTQFLKDDSLYFRVIEVAMII